MAPNTSVTTLNSRAKKCDPDFMGTCVAWNDGSRGVSNGMVSCWGKNITDARIVARDDGAIPFVRPQNLDETLGVTTADKIEMGDGTTLDTFLASIEDKCKYRGDVSVQLNLPTDKVPVVVRAQYAWVPIGDGEADRKVAPAHFSYQTCDASDPKNLLVLGTPSGVYIHTDAPGINNLYAHTTTADSKVEEHWFAVEPSEAKVGSALDAAPAETQDKPSVEEETDSKMEVEVEAGRTEEVPTDTPQSNRDRFVEIGIKGMGLRSNTFVVISIPNKQTKEHGGYSFSNSSFNGSITYRSLGSLEPEEPDTKNGVSSAAIVYADTEVAGYASPITNLTIDRPTDEPIVVTILVYAAIKKHQTSRSEECNVAEDDVRRAVEDIKAIYAKCDFTCKLSNLPVMLHKLEGEHQARIAAVLTQEKNKKQKVDTTYEQFPVQFRPVENAVQLVK